MYIMVNGVKKKLVYKIRGKKNFKKFVMTRIFVTSCHNKNTMHASMIREKKNCLMT